VDGENLDRERGLRLHRAMTLRGHRKMMALAAELHISPAALSKWKKGYSMSIENACRLAELLDVSLDWMLMGRNAPEWMQKDQLGHLELMLLDHLKQRPPHITPMVIAIVSEIPKRSDRN
jgi:transcriptional regulator with XRE-family HTH domain